MHLTATAQSKRARRAPQGELARAVEGPRWAAREVRQPRRPFACASRRPRCSSLNRGEKECSYNGALIYVLACTRTNTIPYGTEASATGWLVRCRWGSLLCAGAVSFQVAVVGSQRRAAGRRFHVRCESRRMSGSREEGRIAKSNRRHTPGPSGLHEGGGISRRWERPTPSGERRGSSAAGAWAAARGGWGGAKSGQ